MTLATRLPGSFGPHVRAAAAAAALTAGAPALAQEAAPGDAGALRVELNKLEDAEGVCQAFFVVENAGTEEVRSLSLDLVVFDGDGIVARRLAAEMGPVGGGKTRLRVFALDGMNCEGVARVLVNGVLSCEAGGGDCADRLRLGSRADAPFGD